MKALRAPLLRFADDGSARFESDGLLVTGPGPQGWDVVLAVGDHGSLIGAVHERWPGVSVQRLPQGQVIAPGFVDTHVHYPQTDVIASPADGLLPWLEQHTFPEEKRFAALDHAQNCAAFFIAEMLRHGVTTALTYATSHPVSVNALFTECQRQGLRWITGKVLQDRHSPDGLRDHTEQSLIDTESLIQRWHGVGRLGYAITPRFAPSCSDAQMQGAGELAAQYPDTWVQSHVAENVDEIRWVHELYPNVRSYLAVYERFGLLRQRAVYGHCIHLNDADRALMRSTGAAAAVCPTSNQFLGSGFFDFVSAQEADMLHGLASDVGGGMSFSPFATMRAAYVVGREGQTKRGISLSPSRLWWLHTAGAAQAVGLGGVVGNLAVGHDADYVVLDPNATPLLARRTAAARDLDEWLFALIVLADDRAVARVQVAGQGIEKN